MGAIWIFDREGRVTSRCTPTLQSAGWTVKIAQDPRAVAEDAEAIVVVNDLAAASALRARAAFANTPIVLLASLDRSGWDRTFDDEKAFDADALLDLDTEPEALVHRLKGIFEARRRAAALPQAADFNVILHRAIDNEEAAERFYSRAAAAAESPATRDVLEGLAREEADHKRTLQEFVEGKRMLPARHVRMTSVLESFGTPEFSADLSPADAFLLAARKEKMAVQFYKSWAALYPEGPERALLLKLADIERAHKNHVEEMFVNASFPEDYYE